MGKTWDIQAVDESGAYTSLALDAAGNPHIGYRQRVSGKDYSCLKYARWTGNTWKIQTVDYGGEVGEYTSLALDGSGYPHISYYDHTNGDLKYAYRDAAGWHIQTVDDAR